MHWKRWWASSCASFAIGAMPASLAVAADDAGMVEVQPPSSDAVRKFTSAIDREPSLSHREKLDLLRSKVMYVFVLFQENRSFDFHLGTFPGANGLFSKPAAETPGFNQPLVDTDGSVTTIAPFLIPQTVTDVNGKTVQIYPADTDSVDHSHTGINNSLHIDSGNVARNDHYALNAEGLTTNDTGDIVSLKTGQPATSPPTLLQKQRAELVVSHVDCDTVPFLWNYADRFALFDNFHQAIIGPSTPNAIALIAGQSGETQWALHPETASNNAANPTIKTSGGKPVVADPSPFAGSKLDLSPIKPPFGPNDTSPDSPTLNQTYATLPLSFMGSQIQQIVQTDQNPALDLLDVQGDIAKIASDSKTPVPWGWYQQGYDHEPTDGSGPATFANYITHHNGPQYFGYIGDNPQVASNLHGLNDFFSDVAAQKLPTGGGVFYVRGGYGNNDNLVPLDPNPAVRKNFLGNDDHPGYSDAQISEALLADEINAIAASPYWSQSAIIIT